MYFKKYGRILESRIYFEELRNKNYKGYGFVLFEDEDSMQKVLDEGTSHTINGVTFECKQSLLKNELEKINKNEKSSTGKSDSIKNYNKHSQHSENSSQGGHYRKRRDVNDDDRDSNNIFEAKEKKTQMSIPVYRRKNQEEEYEDDEGNDDQSQGEEHEEDENNERYSEDEEEDEKKFHHNPKKKNSWKEKDFPNNNKCLQFTVEGTQTLPITLLTLQTATTLHHPTITKTLPTITALLHHNPITLASTTTTPSLRLPGTLLTLLLNTDTTSTILHVIAGVMTLITCTRTTGVTTPIQGKKNSFTNINKRLAAPRIARRIFTL